VMALYMMVLMGGTPIGAPILGWVGEVFGARWTLIGGGALSTLGVLLCVVLLARRQHLHLVPHRHAPHLSIERRAG
jgi:MFS family permease